MLKKLDDQLNAKKSSRKETCDVQHTNEVDLLHRGIDPLRFGMKQHLWLVIDGGKLTYSVALHMSTMKRKRRP